MEEIIKLLIVEDDDAHAELILRSFENRQTEFQVERAASLRAAQEYIRFQLPDVVFTDWILPDGSGIDLIHRGDDGNLLYPAIVMTSFGNEEKAVEAMKAGALDYVVKSVDSFMEMPRIARRSLREWRHIQERQRAERELQQAHIELMDAYQTTLEGWCAALDLRDHETEGHTQRVVAMTARMGKMFDITESELIHIRRGALLHDIGKMGIPDQILLKPGPLTDGEWEIMRLHPVYAYEWLNPIKYLRPAIDIPYCHHERWDGTGYPRGLKGEGIPLAARIFAVVDVWDALTSDRPYRPCWPEEAAFQYILQNKGTHFDPKIIDMLVENGIGFLRRNF